MSIQQSLKLEWDVNTERSLSIAWLKNALNQQTLHFQMLAFVGQPKVAIKFYDKNACVRNIPVLKRLAVGAGDLGEIQFRFEVRLTEKFVPVSFRTTPNVVNTTSLSPNCPPKPQ